MALTVYNWLTRREEEFKPIQEGWVGIYVCGPTVYDHSHIGHAKVYISFDIVVRYLAGDSAFQHQSDLGPCLGRAGVW